MVATAVMTVTNGAPHVQFTVRRISDALRYAFPTAMFSEHEVQLVLMQAVEVGVLSSPGGVYYTLFNGSK